jgi:hypothetical protein
MPRKRKPNRKHQMLNLDKSLIVALKNRSAVSPESMSDFVERILFSALNLEQHQEDFKKFFRWCIHHKRGVEPQHKKFYDYELAFMLSHGVITHPNQWSPDQEKDFKNMFRFSSFTNPAGDNPEEIFNLTQLNKTNFMKAYNVKWSVKE